MSIIQQIQGFVKCLLHLNDPHLSPHYHNEDDQEEWHAEVNLSMERAKVYSTFQAGGLE